MPEQSFATTAENLPDDETLRTLVGGGGWDTLGSGGEEVDVTRQFGHN